MKSIHEATTDGWTELIVPFKETMEPILAALEANNIPVTAEEWQAIMAIYGPMLTELGVDIGTDFIPVVGELKGLFNSGDAIL